jgi:hypothetical protein
MHEEVPPAVEISYPILLAVLATSLFLSLLALVVTAVFAKRQQRLLDQYRVLLNNGSPEDLESLLLRQAATIERVQADLDRITQQVAANEQQARRHLQQVGMVRYNAFPDTGGDQSFSVALLDADANGVVLTSLYGRTETRTYAKPIQGGKSAYPLSDEEMQALAKAQGQG